MSKSIEFHWNFVEKVSTHKMNVTIERKRTDCTALPKGWQREEVMRKTGLSAGKVDVYYYRLIHFVENFFFPTLKSLANAIFLNTHRHTPTHIQTYTHTHSHRQTQTHTNTNPSPPNWWYIKFKIRWKFLTKIQIENSSNWLTPSHIPQTHTHTST